MSDTPRSVLAEINNLWPEIRQLQDGFMNGDPNFTEWDHSVRDRCIAMSFKLHDIVQEHSPSKGDQILDMQDEWHARWRLRRRWIIVEDADGTYSMHEHSADGIAPPTSYPTRRLVAARLLQLLQIGPVAPQDHPEEVCIGTINTAAP